GTGYHYDTCKANFDVLIDYNMFFGPGILEFPDFTMSIYGAQHFKEVKTIFVTLQYIAMGSAVLMIPGVILARKKWAYGWLKATIIVTLSVIGTVGLAMLINWNWTFEMMHKILFRNDYWIFDPWQDPIIRILPDGVFLAYGALILLLMGLGLVIAGLVYRKKTGKSGKKGAAVRENKRSADKR
ncbi:MAG: TIGR01906 family membrane protein, partial [Lachnospiraceae bacterium]|nr:TIGR01906 family membrane protein [Lachnospiraceae bacterium]